MGHNSKGSPSIFSRLDGDDLQYQVSVWEEIGGREHHRVVSASCKIDMAVAAFDIAVREEARANAYVIIRQGMRVMRDSRKPRD